MWPSDETCGSSVLRRTYSGRLIELSSSTTFGCWTLFPHAVITNVAKANNNIFIIYKFNSFDFWTLILFRLKYLLPLDRQVCLIYQWHYLKCYVQGTSLDEFYVSINNINDDRKDIFNNREFFQQPLVVNHVCCIFLFQLETKRKTWTITSSMFSGYRQMTQTALNE